MCLAITRSPAQVLDRTDICGPGYKVSLRRFFGGFFESVCVLFWSLCIFFSSMVILYLRFGAKALQNNFVAELSTHYQNYILD